MFFCRLTCAHAKRMPACVQVPREPLLLVIRAFGGTVAWEGEGTPLPEASEAITHHVVDRPTQVGKEQTPYY